MDVGVVIPQGWTGEYDGWDPDRAWKRTAWLARQADVLGFESIWLFDHFHTVPEPTMNTVFECWTATAGLSRDTSSIKIGQMVTCNGYRSPALLAKMASTVDVMSHGRVICGLGAGWYEHEWRAYGDEFPETTDRMRAFSEACQVVLKMWTEEKWGAVDDNC